MTPPHGALVAFAGALVSAVALPAGAAGDPVRGQGLYAVCSTCHGDNGQGLQEMNAPALAGREAWYLTRQLENFKSGVRGAHPDDTYGRQMAPMAQILADAQAIADVVAYLTGLKH